jgi:large subunit ribosomal protein L25
MESLSLQASAQTIQTLLRTTGRNAIIDLEINGESDARSVMLRGIQRNPVNGALVHVDFFQISLTDTLHAEVPIHLVGAAPAVNMFGGVLLQNLDRLAVEALPMDIPRQIEADISSLEALDSALFVRDLVIPPNVEVLTDRDQVVAKVAAPRLAAEEEVAAPEAAVAEAGEEGAPAAEEGAAVPAAEEAEDKKG